MANFPSSSLLAFVCLALFHLCSEKRHSSWWLLWALVPLSSVPIITVQMSAVPPTVDLSCFSLAAFNGLSLVFWRIHFNDKVWVSVHSSYWRFTGLLESIF